MKMPRDYIEESRKHFDNQARKYDQTNTIYYSKEGKQSCKDIAKYLENKKYIKLLDIGCGTAYLKELLPEKTEYYGLDLSTEMLKVAKNKNLPNTHLTQGRSDQIPYEDNTFDVVTCSQSFHHYPDRQKALQEAKRVLKPDGIYILSDTGTGGISGWFDNNILFKIIHSGDYKSSGRKEIETLLKNEGFEILESYNLSRIVYTIISKK